MKAQSRVVGFSDGHLRSTNSIRVLVGVVYRGSLLLEGVLKEKIGCNEFDLTKALIKCLAKSRYRAQLRLVVLDSPIFFGFNVVDLDEAYRGVGIPVAIVRSRSVNVDRLNALIENQGGRCSKALSSLGEGCKVKIGERKLYVYSRGLSKSELFRALHHCSDETGRVTALESARIIAAAFNRYLNVAKRLN